VSELTYRTAGVDVAAAAEFVKAISSEVASTHGPEVVAHSSRFAGLFRPDLTGLTDPILAATCDGVGTKVLLAREASDYTGLGIDLVAMSVNDLLPLGARPVLFLDYLAAARLDRPAMEAAVRGIAAACRMASCALIGGETAEMPGAHPEGHLELVGFALGLVDGERLPDPSAMSPGDVVLGLPSTGLHANGYTLARRALFDVGGLSPDTVLPELGQPLQDVLLTPTAIYVDQAMDLLGRTPVRAAAHVTGGGLHDRAKGMLQPGCGITIDPARYARPAIIDVIATVGDVPWPEMTGTFNMGLGFLAIVASDQADGAKTAGWLEVGEITAQDGEVDLGYG
jgi:phosphoribosylformylglycinamidine cyclo-ligase